MCCCLFQRTETTLTNQREAEAEAIVARLRARFPKAGPVIKDVLTMWVMDEIFLGLDYIVWQNY